MLRTNFFIKNATGAYVDISNNMSQMPTIGTNQQIGGSNYLTFFNYIDSTGTYDLSQMFAINQISTFTNSVNYYAPFSGTTRDLGYIFPNRLITMTAGSYYSVIGTYNDSVRRDFIVTTSTNITILAIGPGGNGGDVTTTTSGNVGASGGGGGGLYYGQIQLAAGHYVAVAGNSVLPNNTLFKKIDNSLQLSAGFGTSGINDGASSSAGGTITNTFTKVTGTTEIKNTGGLGGAQVGGPLAGNGSTILTSYVNSTYFIDTTAITQVGLNVKDTSPPSFTSLKSNFGTTLTGKYSNIDDVPNVRNKTVLLPKPPAKTGSTVTLQTYATTNYINGFCGGGGGGTSKYTGVGGASGLYNIAGGINYGGWTTTDSGGSALINGMDAVGFGSGGGGGGIYGASSTSPVASGPSVYVMGKGGYGAPGAIFIYVG
jgi:hypothetical protein